MGLSVAASSAILFIGFLFVATALFSGLNSAMIEIQEAYTESMDLQASIVDSSIRVDNATNNTTHVFINVTNIGSVPLKVSDLQIMINGTLVTANITNSSVEGNLNTDVWAEYEELKLEVAYLANGSDRVKVICGNGASSVKKLT